MEPEKSSTRALKLPLVSTKPPAEKQVVEDGQDTVSKWVSPVVGAGIGIGADDPPDRASTSGTCRGEGGGADCKSSGPMGACEGGNVAYDPDAVQAVARQKTALRATLGLVAGAGVEGMEAALADQVPDRVSTRPSMLLLLSL